MSEKIVDRIERSVLFIRARYNFLTDKPPKMTFSFLIDAVFTTDIPPNFEVISED